MTPHNMAEKGDIARTVLMPGDPMRAKFIAESFLEDPKCFNTVRGMLGYTGKYNGKEVSVMASGMGVPSMGIYSYELYNFYDVEQIIRIGSAGSIADNVKLRDIVIGMGTCTDSNYAAQYHLPGTFAPIADFGLLEKAVENARCMNVSFHVGNLLTSDVFYEEPDNSSRQWRKMGVLAVEMESAGLYMNAARCGKKALAMMTVSDDLITGERLSAEERQTSFTHMMRVALEIV